MRIVVIGATSAIAEHCCRLWVAREACDLVLVARNAAKAGRVAEDLRVRSPASTITVVETDFLDTKAIGRLAGETAGQPIDIVLIAHGMLPGQDPCENDLAICRETLDVNAVSPALFAEAFAGHFAKAGRGTIALIGSVAGDRGRKAEGLEHRFAGTGVSIVLIKPGPTDTPMAASHRASGLARLASVEEVARAMVRGIDAKRPVIYAPPHWALIMLVVRHLPRFVFNRLNL
jgi:short-subunit dehydrogenase